MKPTIRASKMPLFMKCPNSILNPDNFLAIDKENEAALLGTEIHQHIADYIEHGRDFNIENLQNQFTAGDYERAAMLVNNLTDVWADIKEFFPDPQIELPLTFETDEVKITGTIDVVKWWEGGANIIDWKTGRLRPDHSAQIKTYALLVWHILREPKDWACTVQVIYLEDKSTDTYEFDSFQLEQWKQEVIAQSKQVRYILNKMCPYCPLRSQCPAYSKNTESALQLVQLKPNSPAKSFRSMTPDERTEFLTKIKQIKVAVDDIDGIIKEEIEANGPIELADNTYYALQEIRDRKINIKRAATVCHEYLDEDEILDCMTVSLSKLESKVMSKAERGVKTKLKEEFLAALREAKALYSYTRKRLKITKGN